MQAFRILWVSMFVLMVAEEMGLNQVTHLLAGRGIHVNPKDPHGAVMLTWSTPVPVASWKAMRSGLW